MFSFFRCASPPIRFNDASSPPCWAHPLLRRRCASPSRTTQFQFSARQAADVHLPTLEFSSANRAHPLVVERIPASEGIARAQDREPIVEVQMSDHNAKRLCSLHRAHNRDTG